MVDIQDYCFDLGSLTIFGFILLFEELSETCLPFRGWMNVLIQSGYQFCLNSWDRGDSDVN